MNTAKTTKLKPKKRKSAPGLLNLVEVAQIVGVPSRTLDTAAWRRRLLDHIKVIDGVQRRYSRVLLQEFLEGKKRRK